MDAEDHPSTVIPAQSNALRSAAALGSTRSLSIVSDGAYTELSQPHRVGGPGAALLWENERPVVDVERKLANFSLKGLVLGVDQKWHPPGGTPELNINWTNGAIHGSEERPRPWPPGLVRQPGASRWRTRGLGGKSQLQGKASLHETRRDGLAIHRTHRSQCNQHPVPKRPPLPQYAAALSAIVSANMPTTSPAVAIPSLR
jgi:hypothetical protein